MQVDFSSQPRKSRRVLVVLVPEDGKSGVRVAAADKTVSQAVAAARSTPGFFAKHGQIADILQPAGSQCRRVLVVGCGAAKALSAFACRKLGGILAAHLAKQHETDAGIFIAPFADAPLNEAEIAANVALGAALRSYRFDKYITEKKESETPTLSALSFYLDAAERARKVWQRLDALRGGIYLARDLTNEPPNTIYPAAFAAHASRALRPLGVKVEVLDEKRLATLGCGALLAVGRAAAHPPRLLVLEWNGTRKSKGRTDGPIALVGKGVCFDSGGLCLKKPEWMLRMKGDMSGGAAVVGAIHALAARKAPVHVVGVVGLVENMPSADAYKPGDIVKTMAGKTIEVIDTDAEGRLVLIDALYYAAKRFKPRAIVDLATLTGSILHALGSVFSGIFATDNSLAEQLLAAGEETGERLWRMPLDAGYDKNLESPIADLCHCAPDAERADAAHAAALLKQFVDKRPWAHLDIAGKEFHEKEMPLAPIGARGYGVALIEAFIAGAER